MPPETGESKAAKPTKDRTNRPKGHFRVDWSTEMEALCFLLGVLYNLYRVDKDLLEQIVFRAFPIFMRARKVAASFYDRIDYRWSPGRERDSWHRLDRLDERSEFHGIAFTPNQLNDLATLDGVVHAWAAQLNKTLVPVAGVMQDFSNGVADPAGILHEFTDTPGAKRSALVPGEQLSADLRDKLESFWGDPIYGFTLDYTLAPGESPPKPNTTKASAHPRKVKAAPKKDRSRDQVEDNSEADAVAEEDALAPKRARRVAPAKPGEVLRKGRMRARPGSGGDGGSEAELSDVGGDQAHRQKRPVARATKRPPTAASSATTKPIPTSTGGDRTYVEMKEEAIAASAVPQQMCMAHYDSLIFDETEVRFKPGTDIPDSFCFTGEGVYEFGGYIYMITLDKNAPPELSVGPDRDRQTVVMAVCNTDICDKCHDSVNQEDQKTTFDPKHSWDIVYRDHLLETVDGTYVFVGNQGEKLPNYTTQLPSTFAIEEVAMQFKMNGEPDPSTIFKVLVCDHKEKTEETREDDQQERSETIGKAECKGLGIKRKPNFLNINTSICLITAASWRISAFPPLQTTSLVQITSVNRLFDIQQDLDAEVRGGKEFGVKTARQGVGNSLVAWLVDKELESRVEIMEVTQKSYMICGDQRGFGIQAHPKEPNCNTHTS
ncbi:hypothetical protein AC579_10199 [Pseudocercospora musae]|uniref:Uncharacterized protein n=1 Tax=Pseudocercospora musae TaxID=113226 RepID=A0A139I343_9PEZI|nr:hypothetical protein AC579_10199 [Pseudocercospora musae]